MTDTPWTPGPWLISETGFILAELGWAGPYPMGRRIFKSRVPNPGDARLIAAAPEMAELLGHIAGGSFAHGFDGTNEEHVAAAHGRAVREASNLLARIRGEA
jgi:hypothetical protein